MIRRMLLACAAAFAVLLVFGSQPKTAHGQVGSFRILSDSYVIVGEAIYHADPLNPPIGWHLMPYASFNLPPVQASSLVSLNSDIAITETGEGWIRTGSGPGEWTSVGQIPGVVGVERSTWGALKARYK